MDRGDDFGFEVCISMLENILDQEKCLPVNGSNHNKRIIGFKGRGCNNLEAIRVVAGMLRLERLVVLVPAK